MKMKLKTRMKTKAKKSANVIWIHAEVQPFLLSQCNRVERFPFGRHYIIKRKLFSREITHQKVDVSFLGSVAFRSNDESRAFNVFSTFAFWVANPIK